MVRDSPSPGPRAAASPGTRRRTPRAKSIKRLLASNLSPFQERLKETEFYTKPIIEKFDQTKSVKARLLLIHDTLSEDITDITRVWPLQLKTKDSRLRRELSEKGKDCFVRGQHDQVLTYYNKALMYSTGKGISHTLARRAAFFLSQGEHSLAVRDLNIALEYGGLDSEELLDFLLTHHIEDEDAERAKNEATIDNAINAIKNAKLDTNASAQDISKWANEIRDNLDKASKLRKNDPKSKKMKDDITKQIIASIKQASKETNLDDNLEIEELQVPVLTEKNPLCPAFSEAAAIGFDPDKGRIVKARRDIKAGEIICVDDPSVSMLCPDEKEGVRTHCLHCFRATKAPLPCDNCCSVVFCSRQCKEAATKSYHQIECQMKLYEMFEHESPEVFKLFMGLRAVTQKPVQHFTEQQTEIEKFLELEEPMFPFPGRAYQSSDYRALANLMTHVTDIDPDIAVKNAVLAVFFLRFLKKAGYFRSANLKLEKNQSLSNLETFILRLIHQVICASTYNSHQVHKLTSCLQLERIGAAVNPSMALVNHSCDSNTIRCNVNKSSILVAVNHIPMGQEITESYSVHYRSAAKNERAYHTLKNYMFECECPACKENWPLEADIPDEIYRIPTFDQEVIYKVRHGDKKDIVKDIIEMRREVEKSMSYNRFKEALVNYQCLAEKLEDNLRHPHAYFLQVRSGITHCIWNLYCTQFPQQEIAEVSEDITAARENAKQIYNNSFQEKADSSSALELGDDANGDQLTANGGDTGDVSSEKRHLYEQTKQLLEQSSQKFSDLKDKQQEIEREKEIALAAVNNEAAAASKTNGTFSSALSEQSNESQAAPRVEDLLQLTEEEKDIRRKQQEYQNEIREQQQKLKDEKRKQWAEEDKERKAREEARKLQRAKQTEERLQQEKEREEKKRIMKKQQEEEMIRQRQIEYEAKKQAELDMRKKQEEERIRKKKREEEELERLLLDIGDGSDFLVEDIEQTNDDVNTIDTAEMNDKTPVEDLTPTKSDLVSEKTNQNIESFAHNSNTMEDEVVPNLTKDITFKNMKDLNFASNEKPAEVLEEPTNVWSSIRKVKEASAKYETIFSTKDQKNIETVSINDIDDMIHQLASQIAEKRMKTNETPTKITAPNLDKIEEDGEETETSPNKETEIPAKACKSNRNSLINNADTNTLKQAFDYEQWRSDMDRMFGSNGITHEDVLKRSASDEMYLRSLKDKIDKNVQKNKKNFKNQDPPQDLLIHENKKNEDMKPPPKIHDEMSQLKLKEKERKRKKQEAVYQQKIESSVDKVKDMSLKSQKLEKISADSEKEILKIKDMASKLVARSQANEEDFNHIFLNLDNLESVMTETDKKKGRKGKKKDADKTKVSVHENNVHWTEEEHSKWSEKQSGQKEVVRVTNLLSALRQAAAAGATDFVSTSISDAISNCKKMQEEHEKEKQIEKELKIKEDAARKDEEQKQIVAAKKHEEEKKEREKQMKIEAAKRLDEENKKKEEQIQLAAAKKKEEEMKKKEMEMRLAASQKLEEEKKKREKDIKNAQDRKIAEEIKQREAQKLENERKEKEEQKRNDMIKKQEAAKEAARKLEEEKRKREEEMKLAANRKMEEEKKEREARAKLAASRKAITEKKEQEDKLKHAAAKKLEEEKLEAERKREREEQMQREETENNRRLEQAAKELKLKEKAAREEEEKKLKENQIKLAAARKLKEENEKMEEQRRMDASMKLQESKKEEAELEAAAKIEQNGKEEEDKQPEERTCKLENNEIDEKKKLEDKHNEQMKRQEEFIMKMKQNEQDKKKAFFDKLEQEQKEIEEEKKAKEESAKKKKLNEEAFKKKEQERKKKVSVKDSTKAVNLSKQTDDSLQSDLSNLARVKMETELFMSQNSMKKSTINNVSVSLSSNDKQVNAATTENAKSGKPSGSEFPPTSEKKSSMGVQDMRKEWPSPILTVKSNSFMPKVNTRNEVDVLKMGSPSQIRKAVKNSINEPDTGKDNNYQISKVPTTTFEFSIPQRKARKEENIEKMATSYAENVAKLSEPGPNRKRSTSVPIPPPPKCKPPPPPKL